MKYKKTMILLVLAIFIFGVASVCASDVNETTIATQEDNQMELTLTEDEISMLDSVEIENVDLIVNPSRYDSKITGKPGIKAYVKSMYVTIVEDDLRKKYGY